MPALPERVLFSYLVLRVIPDVERGECVNVAVVVFSRQGRFLGLRARVDPERLRAIAPDLDPALVVEHVAGLERVAVGDPTAGAVARMPQSERFGWLAAPSSTIVVPSSVHAGLTADPATTLEVLFLRLAA